MDVLVKAELVYVSDYFFSFFEFLWQLKMTIVLDNLVTNNISAQFQTSGILLFTDVWMWKLYGPEVSHFLPCMLLFLDNLWHLFIFQLHRGNRSLHVGLCEKVQYLTLDLFKCSKTKYNSINAGSSEDIVWSNSGIHFFLHFFYSLFYSDSHSLQ